MGESPHELRLQRLRAWRNPAEKDAGLSFVADYVDKNIVRPAKQLSKLIPVWRERVPAELAARTTLKSLARGVLTVHVPDSPTHYELDRLLRSGLEDELRRRAKVPLRKVAVKVVTEKAGS